MSSHWVLDQNTAIALQTEANTVQQSTQLDFQDFNFFISSQRLFYLSVFDNSENYYITDFSNNIWKKEDPNKVEEIMNENNLQFLLFYKKVGAIRDYGSVSDDLQIQEGDVPRKTIISYNEDEEAKLQSLYGESEPEISFSINVEAENIVSFQNSIKTPPTSYDLLSSMGNIVQETITVTATTGSMNELIIEQTESVSDAGGLSGAGTDREITSTGVSLTTEDGGAVATTRTVTTSGY